MSVADQGGTKGGVLDVGKNWGDFYTQGQTKCAYCGDYYPSGWNQHGCREELEALYNSSEGE